MLTVLITAIARVEDGEHVLPRRSRVGRDPGTLVCASSSISTTSGCRARTASRSISSQVELRYSTFFRGTTGRCGAAPSYRALVGLDEPHHDVGAALEAPPSLVEHGAGPCRRRRRARYTGTAQSGDLLCLRRLGHLPPSPVRRCVGTLARRSEDGKVVTHVRRGVEPGTEQRTSARYSALWSRWSGRCSWPCCCPSDRT